MDVFTNPAVLAVLAFVAVIFILNLVSFKRLD